MDLIRISIEEGEASLPAPLAEFAAGLAPELARQTERIRSEQQAVRDFRAALRAGTPHAFVTPILGLACVGVFLAMIRSGVSAVNPDIPSLVDWGAMFGLRVALDHEYWRLFTAMFVHVGIIHLAANMACLAWLGPTIERFFGNLAFAAIYLLSGLGGSIASMAVHPTLAAAGASGAIFGVFGAIVGFLVTRRRSVPRAILVHLLVAALVFIAGSLIAGAFEPRIDLAAHLGGLATGLVCGLVLWRRLPAVPGRRGILRRLAAASAICLLLAVAARAVTRAVARGPEALAIIKQRDAASYDRLALSILKLIGPHASMRRHAEHVLTRMPYQRELAGNDRIVEHAAASVQAFRGLSAEDNELRPILAAVVAAGEEIGAAAIIIKDAFDAEDARLPNSHPSRWSKADHEWRSNLWVEAEQPLRNRLEAGKRAMDRALTLRDGYLKDHGLDEGLARLEPIRRRFREEGEQYRKMYRMDMPDAARNDLTTQQFRERMVELEAMMLEAEWSVRCSPGESE